MFRHLPLELSLASSISVKKCIFFSIFGILFGILIYMIYCLFHYGSMPMQNSSVQLSAELQAKNYSHPSHTFYLYLKGSNKVCSCLFSLKRY